MKIRYLALVALAVSFSGACRRDSCGEERVPAAKITVDLGGKPIRDISESSCCPVLGYAGGGAQGGEDAKWLFETHRKEAAAVFRRCGARFVRQWNAINQWYYGAGSLMRKDKKTGRLYNSRPGMTTPMKNVFSFYKEYGIKVLLTLENHSAVTNFVTGEASTDIDIVKKSVCDYVKWIVDNGFSEVVAGFELGNEPYWAGGVMFTDKNATPERYAARWCEIIPEMKKIFPGCRIGMPLAEYLSTDPDIAAVRARTQQAERLEAKGYFDASCLNQWSGRFVKAMAPQLHNISHIIYHSYGADAPFSATYWGITRYRRFSEAYPEIKGKKFWITEWRDRSDEDVPSHMRFRETLNKSAYMLMMLAQSEVDGMNMHEFRIATGSLAWSFADRAAKTGNWSVQWMNQGPERPDYDSIGESRVFIGSMGPAMQLMVESLRRNPVVMDFGSVNHGSYSGGSSNAVWACSDYYASVLDRRLGIRKGLKGDDLPAIKGDCQYLITRSKDRNLWVLHCVNMNPHDVEADIVFKGHGIPGAPDIRVTSCEERFADAHEIAGFGRLSREYAYQPFAMEAGEFRVTIPGNSVTTVTIPVHMHSLGGTAKRILEAAVIHDQPFPRRPAYGALQSPEDYRHFGVYDRYATLDVRRNGRIVCLAGTGRPEDGAAIKVFRVNDGKTGVSAVLATDIETPAVLEKLKRDTGKLCGIDWDAPSGDGE